MRGVRNPFYAEALRIRSDLAAWRRHLHMNPELGLEEFETAAFVAQRLADIGIEDIKTGVGKTGVVALIRGAKGGKTVALRADMDALPIAEKNRVPYRSKKKGVMHACGHDGNTTCLLGAGALLLKNRDLLGGNVKLIFQPGEEGKAGAKGMIADGVLRSPKVCAMAALHTFLDVPTGKIGIRKGWFSAQSDRFWLTVRGKRAHAASPHNGVDAIATAGHIITAVQTFVTRCTDASDPKIVTLGTVRGGAVENVIARQVILGGTVRTFERETKEKVLSFLRKDVRGIARAFGASTSLEYNDGYPPVWNDPQASDALAEAARSILGEKSVVEIPRASLGGEDFAFYGIEGKIPTAIARLGVYDRKKGFTHPLHSDRFDFDDVRVLPIGAALLAQTAVNLLARV
jgi:amidohydrolase